MKNSFTFLCTILMCFAAFSAKAQTFAESSDNFFQKGNYQEAISGYNVAIINAEAVAEKASLRHKKLQAENCLSYLNKANSLYSQGRYSEAKTEYQKILKINNNDAHAKSRVQSCTNALAPVVKKSNESTFWETIVKENTYEGYKRYLTQYPKGTYAKRAKEIVAEVDLWNNSVKANTKTAYERYLSQAKYGWHKEDAQKKIDDLLWATAREYNTKWSFNQYIESKYLPKQYVKTAHAFMSLIDALEYYEQGDLLKAYGCFVKTNALIEFSPLTQSRYELCQKEYTDAQVKFNEYLQKANQGNTQAQCDVAECYYYGRGVEANLKESVAWHLKASNKNFTDSKYYLGYSYENGEGVDSNPTKAVQYYSAAATKNHAKAQFRLGLCYYTADGITKNDKEALKLLSKSAQSGYDRAQYYLGICYLQGLGVKANPQEGLRQIEQAMKSNSAELQYNFGDLYAEGCPGLVQNRDKALYWYRKAADQKYASALNKLGGCYLYGTGVEKNSDTAMKYYLMAANQGDAVAQYNIAQCYYFSLGVKGDSVRAVRWYMRAADGNHTNALYNLGYCYQYGDGIEQNYTQAVKAYEKAVQNDSPEATLALGLCYKEGTGVAKDERKAFDLILKAHHMKHPKAAQYLSADLTKLKEY